MQNAPAVSISTVPGSSVSEDNEQREESKDKRSSSIILAVLSLGTALMLAGAAMFSLMNYRRYNRLAAIANGWKPRPTHSSFISPCEYKGGGHNGRRAQGGCLDKIAKQDFEMAKWTFVASGGMLVLASAFGLRGLYFNAKIKGKPWAFPDNAIQGLKNLADYLSNKSPTAARQHSIELTTPPEQETIAGQPPNPPRNIQRQNTV